MLKGQAGSKELEPLIDPVGKPILSPAPPWWKIDTSGYEPDRPLVRTGAKPAGGTLFVSHTRLGCHTTMSRQKFILGGIDYPLSHLVGLRINVAAKEPLEAPATLQVTFGHHVYSEKWNPASHGEDHRFQVGKEVRAFCPVRYGCSIKLPDLIKTHVRGKAYLSRDGKGSWNHFFYARADRITYPIFFRLGKADKIHGVDGILHIISAYQNPTLPSSHRFQAVKFARLVHLTCPPPKPDI